MTPRRLVLSALGLLAALLVAIVVVAVAETAAIPVGELAHRVPKHTALMKQREAEARRKGERFQVDQRNVPYERVSPLLRRAILVAEDDAFYMHGGLDWNEIKASARKNLEKRRVVRGGSTITQQLAKNLYLGNERTLTRKLKEMLLAWRIERTLSKRRIFELYLNLIEWGDGIYGAEAAARRYFGVPASDLDVRQALLLASIIINPRRYSPTAPSRRIERRVQMIASRLKRRGFLDESQYAVATGKAPPPSAFDEWFFGLRPHPEPPAGDAALDSLGLEAPEETPEDAGKAPADSAPAAPPTP